MLKKFCSLLLCLTVLLLFSSCSYSGNLSDMSVAQGVSVDTENEKTKVCVQYLDLAKGSSTTEGFDSNITSVACGSGDNISKAVSKASAGVTGPIFFGQNKIIVFGMEYAELGLDGINDYVLRGIDSRPDVQVALCDTSAQEVIRSKQGNAKIPAQSVYDMIKTGERVGLSISVSANELMNAYSDETSDVCLPCLGVNDEKTFCNGIVIFSSQKPAALLDDGETFGFLLMNDLIKGGALNVYDEKLGNVSFEIKSTKIKKTASSVGSAIKFDCKLKAKLILNNTQKGIVVKTSEEDISRLEVLANQELERLCTCAIKKCLDSKSDALFIGKMLAKSDIDAYNRMKSNWHENLENVKFNIDALSEIELISDNSIKE